MVGAEGVRNDLVVIATTPYSRDSEVFRIFEKHYAVDDAPTLVLRASSSEWNPT